MAPARRLLIVGNQGGTNVGDSLRRAAPRLGWEVRLCDALEAFAAPRWRARVSWWLRDRRPVHLARFSRQVRQACAEFRPDVVLSTGLAPLAADELRAIGAGGAVRVNFSTDDPWNRRFGSRWFFAALREYDWVFSPRRANLDELRRFGCPHVEYLPFGYDPDLFFAESISPEEAARYAADVVFAGGADRDRIPYFAALRRAGIDLALYGTLWRRYRETRDLDRGYADPPLLRKIIPAAKVALCLVRRANRDGHVMRSFEVPALGGCMLAERTDEHVALLGEDGAAWFSGIDEMIARALALVADEPARRRIAEAGRRRVVDGGNTYEDRLRVMLEAAVRQ